MNMAIVCKGATAAVGGFVVFWLGGLDKLLLALVALIVLDYITGIVKAVHNRQLSSDVGLRGITRKVLILSVVAVAWIIQGLVGEALPLREVVIMFFVANEALSIMENAAATGLPLPPKLKEVLIQLRDKKEDS